MYIAQKLGNLRDKTANIFKIVYEFLLERKELLFKIAALLIILLGIYYRLDGYFIPPSFNSDEAQIARYLSRDNGLQKTIQDYGASRPFGYLVLSKAIIEIYNTEQTLRLTSLIPGIISLFLAYLIFKKAFKSNWTILIMLALFTLNPFLISFSKSFKSYSFDIFIHILIFYSFLLYYRSNKAFHFILLCVFLYFSIFFSINIIFIYPALFLLLGYKFLILEKDNKKLFISIIIGMLLIATILIFYTKIWSHSMEMFVDRWEESSYRGFAPDNRIYIFWIFEQLYFLLIYFFQNEFNGFNPGFLIASLTLVGIIYMVKEKKHKLSFLILLTLLTAVLFNLFDFWPLGTDRTNLFLIFYFLFLAGMGFELIFIYRKNSIKNILGLILFISFFAYMLPYDINYYEYPNKGYNSPNEDMTSPLKFLYENYEPSEENSEKKPNLVVNWMGNRAFEYYVHHHSLLSEKYKDFFYDNFNIIIFENRYKSYVKNEITNLLNKKDEELFFLFYHHWKIEELFYEILDYNSVLFNEQIYPNATLLKVIRKDNIPVIPVNKKIEAENLAVSMFQKASVYSDLIGASESYVKDTNLFFKINVEKKGVYRIKIKALSKDFKKDSWFLRIDDERIEIWDLSVHKSWAWHYPPIKWKLEKGEHLISLLKREPTPTDQIEVRLLYVIE